MSGVSTNQPTNIEGYTLTAAAAFSIRSIVGISEVDVSGLNLQRARPLLARADALRKLDEVRFITESHVVAADAELFREKLDRREQEVRYDR